MKGKFCVRKNTIGLTFFLILIAIGLILYSSLFGRQIVLTQKTVKTNAAPATIAGGESAKPGEFPFMVVLYNKQTLNDPFTVSQYGDNLPLSIPFFCAGSLINNEWVLTAAHCLDGIKKEDIGITVGYYDISEVLDKNNEGDGNNKVYRDVWEVVIHQDYKYQPYAGLNEDDIALLKLNQSLPSHFKPVTLSDEPELEEEKKPMMILGWGQTDSSLVSLNKTSNILNKAYVFTIANKRANKPDWYRGLVGEKMIALGFPKGGVDTCKNDSGGPVIAWSDQKQLWVQTGITSWGYGCAKAKQPGVYTRVRSYLEWINQKTGGVTSDNVFNGDKPGIADNFFLFLRLREFDEDDRNN